MLAKGGVITDPQLPFSIRVKSYAHNSDLSFRAPMMQNGPPLTTNGVATSFDFVSLPDSKTMDQRNIPTAVIEIIGQNGASMGEWVASDWASDAQMLDSLYWHFDQTMGMGPDMANNILGRLTQTQSVQANGKEFSFVMRPERVWMPYSLTLEKASHSVYVGSDTPKDFRSNVLLQNPKTGEKRPVEIFMNSPLRYQGQTFYQYQMNAGEIARDENRATSVLMVVRNPSWVTPYVGCILVALGLVIQFLSHLTKFMSRRNSAPQSATVSGAAVNGASKKHPAKHALEETVRK
jgi:hypothetical protein